MPDDYTPPRLYRLCPADAHTCVEARCLDQSGGEPCEEMLTPSAALMATLLTNDCVCGKFLECQAAPGARCANLPIPTP
jgi:hypothetical protein